MHSNDRPTVQFGGLFRRTSRKHAKSYGKELDYLALFAESIRKTSDGMALADAQGTFLWVNKGMSDLTGYPVDEIIGQTLRLFESGLQSRSFYQRLWANILAGQIFQGEVVNRRKDGSLYTSQVTITPIKTAEGVVSHFAVMERDLSKRVALEESLRAGQDRFKNLVETMSDGLAILDEEEVITYANPVFMTKLGFSPAELIGRSFLNLLDEDNKKLVLRQTSQRKNGMRLSYDLEIPNKSGDKKVFRIAPSGLFNEEGKFTGSFAIFRDVSHEKNIELQLLDAKQKAEGLGIFQSTILDNISHEFRTPLSSILGFADLLKESVGNNEKEFVQHIQDAGHRLLQTLNSVVDMSSVLSENFVRKANPSQIGKEVFQIVNFLKPIADSKGIVLKAVNKLIEKEVEIDKYCFVKIAENLIGNAIKFTAKGSVVVEVRDSSGQDGYFDFVVRDTGIGIDPKNQKLIFDLFHQESTGVSREYQGMGLGLSFTNLLVKQLGGSISLTSDKSFGSEFVVRLPKKGGCKI